MWRSLPLLLVLSTLAGPLSAAQRIAPGDPVPACAALDEARRAAYAGRVTVIDFWASWCPPCRKLMPLLDELRAARAADGLAVVAINVDEKRKDAEHFLARVAVRYPVVFDPAGHCPAVFGVPGMPTTYLVDRRGIVRHVHSGFREDDAQALVTDIDALLAEPAHD
ncbi:MAG: TlpA family protein disulfide reductase [Gammaproteobacteria bacterium]